MQITLNETTAEQVRALAGENGTVDKVVEVAVDNLTWAKAQIDAGKSIISANKAEEGWTDAEFYPMDSVLELNVAEEEVTAEE